MSRLAAGAKAGQARRGFKLKISFFRRTDALAVSRELLGKFLCTRLGGQPLTAGMIVETEAYAGAADRACHGFGNRRTARNRAMFEAGGVAYVYLCYGIHFLLNVVTGRKGVPHASLIRAVQPTQGIATMLARRGKRRLDHTLAGGPGALTAALGITLAQNGVSLVDGRQIWVEDRGVRIGSKDIVAGPRVGVAYAGPDAGRPWRFRVRNNPWVSRAK